MQIDRRTFLKTLGGTTMAAMMPSVFTGCQNRTDPPNILWITVEDISPMIGCYGHDRVHTPNIDKLAQTGVMFKNTFMPAPVCSPCRSALITGMMATSTGVHNHHSSRTQETAIHLPEHVQTLPEIMREAGYFTFNHGKDDYNFWYDREKLYSGTYRTHKLYGNFGDAIDWNARQPGQPFFGQIQLYGNKYVYSKNFSEKVQHPVDRQSIEVPPYYPDIPEIREDLAKHLECIQITDREVGDIIARLKKDGLLENTVIFFYSDHGMRLWRHKQFCYDSSVQVPFIVNWAGNARALGGAGAVRSDLISGLDITATTLYLAGIPVPDYMESKNLFARRFSPRSHVISARDRCDYAIDRIRSVRTERFRYIRNFFPDRPYMQPHYRDEWDITQTMRRLHKQGKLDPVQDSFWSEYRPAEELYNIEKDPHEIHNLAGDAEYEGILAKHRHMLEQWIDKTGDKGQYKEDAANLKFMYDWWGDKCVNPEYDMFKQTGK